MGKRISGGRSIALGGILCALSLVVLYLSCIIPTGQLGLVAVAGVLPAAVVVASGIAPGLLCYGSTGILALILLPNKTNALLYLLLFGLYPMVKSALESRASQILAWLGKLGYCNLMLALSWLVLRQALFAYIGVERWPLTLLWVGANVMFLVFDLGFSRLIFLYEQRIQRFLK